MIGLLKSPLPAEPVHKTHLAAPTDGCPDCVRRYNRPRWSRIGIVTGTLYGGYECDDCRYEWFTGWAPEAASNWVA